MIAVVVVLAVLAAGTVVFFVVQPHADTYSVGAAGGTVGKTDGTELIVPPSQVAEAVTVAMLRSASGSPDNSSIDDYALRVGDPVEITTTNELAGSQISMQLDARRLPANATTTNAFIAVYDEDIRAWMPLESTYARGRVTATTPHFSWYSTFVVNPVKQLWNESRTGVQALVSAAVTAVKEAKEAFAFRLQEIECTQAAQYWSVSAPVSAFTGCVVQNSDGSLSIRVANSSFLRYVLSPSAKYIDLNEGDYAIGQDVVTAMSRASNHGLRKSAIPGRGRTQMTIPSADIEQARRDGISISMEPDLLGFGLDVALIALAVAPEFRVELNAWVRASAERAVVRATEETTSIAAFKGEFEASLHASANIDPEALSGIFDAYNCISEEFGAMAAKDEAVITRVMSFAKECAGRVISENYKDTKNFVTTILSTVPSSTKVFLQLVDAGKAAADTDTFLGQFTMTATYVPPAADVARAATTQAFAKSMPADGGYGFIRALDRHELYLDKVTGGARQKSDGTYEQYVTDADGDLLYHWPLSPKVKFVHEDRATCAEETYGLSNLPSRAVTASTTDISQASIIKVTDGMVTEVLFDFSIPAILIGEDRCGVSASR